MEAMRRESTFYKEIELVVLSWGIDSKTPEALLLIRDFSERMEKIYNNTLENRLNWARSLPNCKANYSGKIVDTIVDKERKSFIVIFENNTKISIPIEELLQGRKGGEPLNLKELDCLLKDCFDKLKQLNKKE